MRLCNGPTSPAGVVKNLSRSVTVFIGSLWNYYKWPLSTICTLSSVDRSYYGSTERLDACRYSKLTLQCTEIPPVPAKGYRCGGDDCEQVLGGHNLWRVLCLCVSCFQSVIWLSRGHSAGFMSHIRRSTAPATFEIFVRLAIVFQEQGVCTEREGN